MVESCHLIRANPPPREEGWTRSGRGGRSHRRLRLSDHPVCGAKEGFAENFLMPQPPLVTRRGIFRLLENGAKMRRFQFTAFHSARIPSTAGRPLFQKPANHCVTLPAFEKEGRHSKKKTEPWPVDVDCEWMRTNPSSLSEYPQDADS